MFILISKDTERTKLCYWQINKHDWDDRCSSSRSYVVILL